MAYQTSLDTPKSTETINKWSIAIVQRRLGVLKNIVSEKIMRKPKYRFTKEQLEQAEQAWIRG